MARVHKGNITMGYASKSLVGFLHCRCFSMTGKSQVVMMKLKKRLHSVGMS